MIVADVGSLVGRPAVESSEVLHESTFLDNTLDGHGIFFGVQRGPDGFTTRRAILGARRIPAFSRTRWVPDFSRLAKHFSRLANANEPHSDQSHQFRRQSGADKSGIDASERPADAVGSASAVAGKRADSRYRIDRRPHDGRLESE